MSQRFIVRLLTILSLSLCFAAPLYAQSISARTLIERSAQAMGGMAALRAIKNQVVESEGKQFDSSSTPKPLGPTQQISTFILHFDTRPYPAAGEDRVG